ncbi:MAG: transcriptional regulator, partial [Hyphomicrobium sp.]
MQTARIPKVISFQDSPSASGVETQHYHPEADRILEGDPAQSAANMFSSADGRFNCGVWTCQPGKWRVVFSES